MSKTEFCPECGRLAEYDPYYDRFYCTSCNWRSDRIKKCKVFNCRCKDVDPNQCYMVADTHDGIKCVEEE